MRNFRTYYALNEGGLPILASATSQWRALLKIQEVLPNAEYKDLSRWTPEIEKQFRDKQNFKL